MSNKNSTYVGALVSFLKDTKPFHSKVTEAIEEYRFSDTMLVNITERLFSSVTAKAAWPYSYFSSGSSTPTMPLHRVVSPLFRGMTLNSDPANCSGAFKVGRDESTDLALTPLVFDPTAIEGVGLADAFVQRGGLGTRNEALVDGIDVHLSRGAFLFSIKQTVNASNQYSALFTERRAEGVLAHATAVARAQAHDVSNPSSAINKIKAVLLAIETQLNITPDTTGDSEAALADLNAIIASVQLPTSYDALIRAVRSPNWFYGPDYQLPYTSYGTWEQVHELLSAYTTALYRNQYNDMTPRTDGTGIGREVGSLRYSDILDRSDVTITNIVADPNRVAYEEFTLDVAATSTVIVRGSVSGTIGTATVGTTFSSPQLSFTLSAGTLNVGDQILLTPSSRITVHKNAALETWSLIKVGPMAYSRPALASTRYGYLLSSANEQNRVTILDDAMPNTTIVIRAVSSTQFQITSAAEPAYQQTATVNVPFNDGRLAFTIKAGSAYTFTAGDVFYVEIANTAPFADGLDLYYGFDMDPYDGGSAYVYNAVPQIITDYLTTLDFGWDSRFISYDLASFGLQIGAAAVNNRQWRLRAIPDVSRPLVQRDTNDNRVNQTGDELNPLFDRDGDGTVDIRLYYASSFVLEYLNGTTWTSVGTIPVGGSYSNTTHGLSFTLIQAAKPFIGAQVREGGQQYDGGDVIAWTVRNDPPSQQEPAALVSPRAPRLVMYSNGYHNTTPAKWVLKFTGAHQYTLQGFYTTGPQNGSAIYQVPVTITLSDGNSYRNDELGLHWTVVQGNGLGANDTFTFETFEQKPTILVHGSVSGWQANAELDKWYWNGKIGFKIKSPRVHFFDNTRSIGAAGYQGEISNGETFSTSLGDVLVNIRRDCAEHVYLVKAHNDGHWMLYRDGAIIDDGDTVVHDEFVRVQLPTAVAGASFTLHTLPDDFSFALGHDLAIVRTTAGRAPTSSDFVLFNRTKQERLSISIKAKDPEHGTVLSALAPTTIDLRYVDHTANSGVPLSNTSPEVAVLPGWIPSILSFRDSSTSTAEFSDAGVIVEARAAATGEVIGTVESIGTTPDEPVIFRWDSSFATKYLPLNAESTVVTLGSGMNEVVHVNMAEGIQFLLGGGGLDEDAMFAEEFSVHITEDNQWNINLGKYLGEYEGSLVDPQNPTSEEMAAILYGNTGNVNWQPDSISISVQDGPFGGFLPGYDNLPFDMEDGVNGYYDAGQALTSWFEEAHRLALQNVLNATEQARLNDLRGLLNPYLVAGDPGATTLDVFLNGNGLPSSDPNYLPGLLNDDSINYTPNAGFGIPSVGMGMDVNEKPTATVGATIVDAVTVLAIDGEFRFDDDRGYDAGPLDYPAETTAILSAPSLAPLPSSGLPPNGTAYADFQSPLEVSAAARIIEITFPADVIATPAFYVFRPTDSAPVPVPIVEKFNSRSFRLRLPVPSELKLIVV